VRLKSELWVKACIRQCAAAGLWAVVARRGDPDAGIIFVRIDLLDGRVRLFGPAMGSAFDEAGERLWAEISAAGPMTDEDARGYLDRRSAFDPDIWVVDIESRDGVSPLSGVVTR
jgi:hypothetical protein